MQVPKKHLPVVGLLGLIVVAAAGGTIYYYQFVIPHVITHAVPSHRLIFMTAIVFEEGGFTVTNTAYLNQTNLPGFNTTSGYNLAGVDYHNYQQSPKDNKTIYVNSGDTLTFYIKGKNATSTSPLFSCKTLTSPCHSFVIDVMPTPVNVLDGQLGQDLFQNMWYSVTFRINGPGSYEFRCLVPCSMGHTQMFGNIVAT